jgi:fructose-bisphosphate aldolase class II
MPSAETVAKFVTDTGIDCVAPAVGNVHGMLKNASNPKLNIDLIHQIVTATSAHLVLHGGSGITDEDFRAAISAGISAIHINTEIRAAWKHALQSKLSEDENEVAPYKLLKPSYEAVLQVVASRLRLFSNKP